MAGLTRLKCALVVDGPPVGLPALAPQEHVQAPVAVAHPRGCQVPQPDAQGRLVLSLTTIVVRGPVLAHEVAGMADADLEADGQERDEVPLLGRLQSFFVITSWSMCLSRVRSATRDLSFLFSSSTCSPLRAA